MKLKLSQSTVIIIAAIIILGAGFIWFFSSFDKVYYTKDQGFSEAARKNRFLAAELYLGLSEKKLIIDNHFNIFKQSLKENDTVIINSSRIGMSAEIKKLMTNWLEAGGNLVLLATEPFEYDKDASKDDFLDKLGLRFYKSDYRSVSASDEEDNISQITFSSLPHPLDVKFLASGYIEDTSNQAITAAGTAYAEHFIQYELGKGKVTVMTDLSLWNNFRIEDYDHALFLKLLVGDSDTVWMLYNRIQPSLASLSVQHIPLVLISTAAILLLLFFSLLWRKGPKIQDHQAINREIMQHLSASAVFQYNLDNGETLLHDLRAWIDKRMNQLVHGYNQLTATEQIQRIAMSSGIKVEQLSLLNLNENTEDVFLEKVKLLQKIRKQL